MKKKILLKLLVFITIIGNTVLVAQNEMEAYWRHINKVKTLYNSKDYQKCLVACNDAYNGLLQVAATTTNIAYKDIAYRTELWSTYLDCHMQLKDYKGAIAKSNQFIQARPDVDFGFMWLGDALSANEECENAIPAYDKALSLGNYYSHQRKAVCYEKLGKYNEAISAYKNAMTALKWDVPYLQLANLYQKQGDYNNAKNTLNDGLNKLPESLNLMYMTAWANFYVGNIQEATNLITKYITKNSYGYVDLNLKFVPERKKINAFIGSLNNNGPAAQAGFKEGDKIISVNGNSIYNKGDTENELNNYLQSELKGETGTSFEIKVEQNGKIYKNSVTRVITYKEAAALGFGSRSIFNVYNNKLSEANSDLKEALKLPQKESTLLAEGLMELNKNNFSGAITKFKQAGKHPYVLMNLAIAEAKNNNMSASISAYKEIAEINYAKENVTLEKDRVKLMELYTPVLKEYLNAADKYISNGQYKEAISELAKASNMQSGDAKLKTIKKMFDIVGINPAAGELSEEARKYALRSEMLVKEADFNGAESELLKAIQLAPYDAKLYFNMAIINSELKHYQEAINYMKIYVNGVPDAPNNRQAKDEIIKWEFMLERGK